MFRYISELVDDDVVVVDLSQHIVIPQKTPPVEGEEVCRNIRRDHHPRYCAGYKALYLQAEYVIRIKCNISMIHFKFRFNHEIVESLSQFDPTRCENVFKQH